MKKGLFTLLTLILTALPALAAPGNTSGPWGVDVSAFANLSSAKRSPATANKAMVITSVMNCGNLTIPVDRVLDIKKGGRIRYSGNLVINSPFNPGLYYALEQVGSGTVTFGPGAVKEILPQWWGGDASGVSASDASFVSAMNAAFSSSDVKQNLPIHLTAGKWLFTTPNLLNQWVSGSTTHREYVKIYGDGMGVTNITFKPATVNAWLYNGIAVTNRRLMFLDMSELSITFSGTTSGGIVNGFRQNGGADGYPDQAYTFTKCRFDADASHPGVLLYLDGTINGSENKFQFCRGYFWSSVLYVTNPQAVNHYFIGCDFELTKGDVFYFSAGSSLNVVGGSYILGQAGDTLNGSLLRLVGGSGGITGTFNFSGIRTEIYDTTATIYKMTGINLLSTVNVIGSTHRIFNGGNCDLVRINSNSGAKINFTGCDLKPNANLSKIVFENTQGTANWQNTSPYSAQVLIENSGIKTELKDNVTWETNAEGGLFRTRNCHNTYTTVINSTPSIALDWDMTGTSGNNVAGRYANAIQIKSISIPVIYWPIPLQPALTAVVLPVNTIVKAIRVRKSNKGDGDTTVYQLTVTNSDGSYTYGSSTLGQRKDEHLIILENINRAIAATGVNQTILLTCTAGNFGDNLYQGMGLGDMFIVEYY